VVLHIQKEGRIQRLSNITCKKNQKGIKPGHTRLTLRLQKKKEKGKKERGELPEKRCGVFGGEGTDAKTWRKKMARNQGNECRKGPGGMIWCKHKWGRTIRGLSGFKKRMRTPSRRISGKVPSQAASGKFFRLSMQKGPLQNVLERGKEVIFVRIKEERG